MYIQDVPGDKRGYKRKIDRVLEDLVAQQMKKAIAAASPAKPGTCWCTICLVDCWSLDEHK